ncbi:MAG: hypothetical protein ABEH78_03340 [Haloferacaceae archaeon]
MESVVDGFIEDAFTAVEEAIATEVDAAPSEVSFDYETKLTLPAELTLGYVYYRARQNTPQNLNPVTRSVRTPLLEYFRVPFDRDDETERRKQLLNEAESELRTIDRAESVTELVVIALIDGDMRDALNDEEFEDFSVDFPVDSTAIRRQIATVAQSTLRGLVEERFAAFDDDVRTAYEQAVAISERHQEQDDRFRRLAAAAREGDAEAREQIYEEYKHASFGEVPDMFDGEDVEHPYLKTQYERVGVIYDGMVDMYRAAGVPVSATFKKAIVFAIIGAQIWLDDIDDYVEDLRNDQLTPVTAEYLLADTDAKAYEQIVDITESYLNAAKRYAAATDSPLAGIGADYIFRSGNPSVLP